MPTPSYPSPQLRLTDPHPQEAEVEIEQILPPTVKLKFDNAEAAAQAGRSPKKNGGRPWIWDETYPVTQDQKCFHVIRIIECMRNTENVQDNEGLVKAWEKACVEKEELIEIRAWALLVSLTQLEV